MNRKMLVRKLGEIEGLLASGEPLTIGAEFLPDHGISVLMGAGGKMLVMSPQVARRVADVFDCPAAHAVGLTVAKDLRDAAAAGDAFRNSMQ